MSYPGNDSSGTSPEPSPSEPPAPYNPYATPPTPPPAPPMSSPPMSPPPTSPPPPPVGPGVPAQPLYSAPPQYPTPQYPTPQYPPPAYGPATTTQLPPVPAPPTYDPAAMAAQQYSAPPVSGPYGYVTPLASAIPAPPPAKGRGSTIVLSILSAVFVVVAAVMGTLFFIKNQDATTLSNQVTQLTSDNKTQHDKLESTQKDLDSAKRDLSDSDDEVDELTTQKKALADCLTAFYEADDAVAASNGVRTAEVTAKIAEFSRLCAAANKYL